MKNKEKRPANEPRWASSEPENRATEPRSRTNEPNPNPRTMNSVQLLFQHRRVFIALTLSAIVATSIVAAFVLRFDILLREVDWEFCLISLAIALPIKLAIFYSDRLDRGWTLYAGIADLWHIFSASTLASLVFGSVVLFVLYNHGYPRGVLVLDWVICFLLLAAARLSTRLLREHESSARMQRASRHVLVYGAGWAGASILRELRSRPDANLDVAGFIDDDPKKAAEWVLGVPVLGAGADLNRILNALAAKGKQIDQVLIAMPSALPQQLHRAVELCRDSGVACKKLPALTDLLSGQLSTQLQNITVEDLLYREPVHLETTRIAAFLRDQVVLVTGGAGSIGSELCRQVANFAPKRLVILDQAESAVFEAERILRTRFPQLNLSTEIGDIRNRERVREILAVHRPEVIFHAAAYKHVPLMERHPLEAIRNNILATRSLAEEAIDAGVGRFVMISTDKAVNPTSVMGASKRAAELVVSSFPTLAENGRTCFVAVRFGNVLASNGSVVPVFQAQIAAGGPVTVTHPEIRRFFMTVPEAAQLVLQAGSMGQGAEVYVLEMGKLIRIVDLARDLIRLSGFVPDRDIPIVFTGLRPGEKLYEEVITEGENILPTGHDKVRVFQGPRLSATLVKSHLRELEAALDARDREAALAALRRFVPEYQPPAHEDMQPAGAVS